MVASLEKIRKNLKQNQASKFKRDLTLQLLQKEIRVHHLTKTISTTLSDLPVQRRNLDLSGTMTYHLRFRKSKRSITSLISTQFKSHIHPKTNGRKSWSIFSQSKSQIGQIKSRSNFQQLQMKRWQQKSFFSRTETGLRNWFNWTPSWMTSVQEHPSTVLCSIGRPSKSKSTSIGSSGL